MNDPANTNPVDPPGSVVGRRRWLAGAAAGILALGTGAGHLWWQRRQAREQPVHQLWQLRLPAADGSTLVMSDWLGQPLLINFWATWCAPCVRELPLLNHFHQQQPRWQVLGIAVDTPANVARFVQRFSLAFPNGIAGTQGIQLSQDLGNTSGLPFTLVIDAGGTVRARKSGLVTQEDLQQWKSFS